MANSTEDPARREELLTYVFVGGGYAGLEALAELQDFAADAMEPLSARPAARDALDPGRGARTACCPRSTPSSPTTPSRELRGRGIEIRLGTTLEEVDRRRAPRSRPGRPSPPGPSSGPPACRRTRASRTSRSPLDERGRVKVDDHLRVEGLQGVWALGDCAAVPDPRGGCARRPRSTRSARRRLAARQHRRRPRRRAAAAIQLREPHGLRQPRPLQGGRPDRPAARFSGFLGLVDGADLPPEPDPGHLPQGARGARLDRRACPSRATSPRSARSGTRARCAARLRARAAATARSALTAEADSSPAAERTGSSCLHALLVEQQVAPQVPLAGGQLERARRPVVSGPTS